MKAFRDKVLAHTLLGEALDKTPTYRDLFLLIGCARDATNHAKLAIRGCNRDLNKVEEERVRISKAFWQVALDAVAKEALAGSSETLIGLGGQ